MSTNVNSIFIFVKGFKGKYAYEITDFNFNTLYQCKNENVLEDGGEKTSPIHSDAKAMIDSLDYVKKNRGTNKIPQQPVTFLFTTYEPNFHTANNLKEPDKLKEKVRRIDKLKKELARSIYDRDQVKIYWIPKNFENRMQEVERILVEDINPRLF